MRSIDRALDDLFRPAGALPVQFVEETRTWRGSTLTFAMSAKMGFVSTPIKGTIDVTDKDVTIDADLGILERIIGSGKARDALASRIRGLLT